MKNLIIIAIVNLIVVSCAPSPCWGKTTPTVVSCKQEPSKYPTHWGAPPEIQTMDYRKLPTPFGYGSSTLAKWIETKQSIDAAREDLIQMVKENNK